MMATAVVVVVVLQKALECFEHMNKTIPDYDLLQMKVLQVF